MANLRLCCRAHNQYQAERTFGAGFMAHKRAEARASRAARHAPPHGHPNASARHDHVAARLRALGFGQAESPIGAALCDLLPDAPLEDLVSTVISKLGWEVAATGAQPPAPPPDAETSELHYAPRP